MNKMVGAAEFKAKCLKLIDEMQKDGVPITITKRGKPVAEVRPNAVASGKGDSGSLFGSMRGQIKILGDIVGPVDPDWEAEWDTNNPPELYKLP